MLIRDVIELMESWAPRWTAWSKDNVGLQVGDASRTVRRILIALDVVPAVVQEAIHRRVDLIVSHHPLLFRPPSSITASDPTGSMVLLLAEKMIGVFSAHTNLDFAQDGVSMTLAKKLGITSPRFLSPLSDTLAKIIVFVPEGHVDRVRSAMAASGAGVIGEYSSCSFASSGRGSFLGSSSANPYMGAAGTLEFVDEVRLEMVAPRAEIDRVIRAMKSVHPYEEAAYDVFSLQNPSTTAGMGAIGDLPKSLTTNQFLATVHRKLRPSGMRHSASKASRIRRVAVCSGSGSDLLNDAVQAGADAFVTADIRYHSYHSAEGRILLVDAGHWETENVVVPVIASRLKAAARAQNAAVQVYISQRSTNPVRSAERASA
jgi:dinuclear metal center YbgI/SA1388 family protein